MPIRIACPNCESSFNVPENVRGKKVRCPECQDPFVAEPARKTTLGSAAKQSPTGNGKKTSLARDTRTGITDRVKAPPVRNRKDNAKSNSSSRESSGRNVKKGFPWLLVGGLLASVMVGVVGIGAVGGVLWYTGVVGGAKDVPLAQAKPNAVADEPKKDEPNKEPQKTQKDDPVRAGNEKVNPPIDKAPPVERIAQAPPIPQGPPVAIPEGEVPAVMGRDTVKKVKKAAVYIKVTDATGQVGEGSGFFGLEPGVVVTNAHVVGMLAAKSKSPKKVEVVVYSGTPEEFKLDAMVLGADRDNDLAILRLQGDLSKIPSSLPVEADCSLTEVQRVYIFGFPFGSGLGKEITVSESSVSSFRKDSDGALFQIQVNGGMHPGNSGGPVVDGRGVVVGVSVAGIKGTQVNYAVPAEKIHGMLHGRVQEIMLGEAYNHDKTVKLPLKIACLDPLQRVRDLTVDIWTGPSGPARRTSLKAPQQLPGDSPKSSTTLTYQQGLAVHELVVPTMTLPPGHVYWIQPRLTTHAGLQQWASTSTFDPAGIAPLNRVAANLTFSTATSERSLNMHGKFEFQLLKGKDKPIIESDDLKFQILEEMTNDPKGAALRVAMGKGEFSSSNQGQTKPRQAEAQNLVKRKIFNYQTNPTGRLEVFGFPQFRPTQPPINPRSKIRPPPPPVISLEKEIMYIEAEDMASMFNTTYQLSSMSVPNRQVQPLEVWDAKIAILVGTGKKKTTLDLVLKYTFEGIRSVNGKTEGLVTIAGEVEKRNAGRDDSRRPKSRVVGQGSFDVAAGFFTKLKVAIRNDIDVEGMAISQVLEANLTRVAGNIYKIGPLPPRTPAPDPNNPNPNPGQTNPGPTPIAGGGADPQFRDDAPGGALLIGFEIGLGKFGAGDVIKAVRPIYRNAANQEIMGRQYGTQLDRVVTVKAKPGYAVGTMIVRAGLFLDGMSLVFMRVDNGKLNPADSYPSNQVGGLGGNPNTFGGSGAPIIGIVGKTRPNECSGLGLVLGNVNPGGTVSNPGVPGGNPNPVIVSNPSGIAITMPANSLCYNPKTNHLYVTMKAEPKFVALDPATGKVVWSVAVAGTPNQIALAQDGKTAWIGFLNASAIQKIDLDKRQALDAKPLPGDPRNKGALVESMQILPGNSDSVAVALKRGGSPRHGGVVILDNGVPRPNKTRDHTGANTIVTTENPAILFGYNNETTEFGLRRFVVEASGIREDAVFKEPIKGFYAQIKYAAGKIISGTGQVVDAKEMKGVGTIIGGELDVAGNRIVVLGGQQSLQVHVYELNSLTLKETVNLPPTARNDRPPHPAHRGGCQYVACIGTTSVAVLLGDKIHLMQVRP